MPLCPAWTGSIAVPWQPYAPAVPSRTQQVSRLAPRDHYSQCAPSSPATWRETREPWYGYWLAVLESRKILCVAARRQWPFLGFPTGSETLESSQCGGRAPMCIPRLAHKNETTGNRQATAPSRWTYT